VVTTEFNVAAAMKLLKDHHFRYVLPAFFSQDPLEKFFGQARQRFGGNFYIDVGDVLAAAKVQRFHQLLKLDIIFEDDAQRTCCRNFITTLLSYVDAPLYSQQQQGLPCCCKRSTQGSRSSSQ